MRPLIIIHGWSDHSSSFKRLENLLKKNIREPLLVDLADYVSMDDDVTFDDIVTVMQRAWIHHQFPKEPGSVDMLVHSTGGLIVRDWLSRFYTPQTAPVKHLVMLAPANFGSQLAHRGRAFYARVIEGYKSKKLFNVGAKLLKGLELASPYTWQLAMRDRFGEHNFYGPGKILCTVLVGNTGYSGISAAANEVGSDGTVRMSCANLNASLLNVDFTKDPLKPSYVLKSSQGQTAFGVLDSENHHTIVAKDDGPVNKQSLEKIIQALRVSDEEFPEWCETLKNETDAINQHYHANPDKAGYQNTVIFVQDQFGQHINDYFVEFYDGESKTEWFEEIFYRDVIYSAHGYSDDSSFKSLYLSCSNLYKHMDKPWDKLHFSLTAYPEYDAKQNTVGYKTFDEDHFGEITVPKSQIDKIIQPNRTLMVHFTLRREQTDQLFQLASPLMG